MTVQDIILHYYIESPFCQKVAWVLNYKNIDYKTVLISRLEPRPLRRPLDGGYRKSPILQIGSHVYCDSKIIFLELEKLFPEPSLFPKLKNTSNESSEGLARGLAIWIDSTLFLNVVSQLPVKHLPDEFLADRGQLIGQDLDRDKIAAGAPFMRTTILSEFNVIENILGSKSWILETETPSSIDFSIAMITWFLINMISEQWVQDHLGTFFKHMARTLEAANWERTSTRPTMTENEAIEVLKRHSTDELAQGFEMHTSTLPIELGKRVVVTPLDTGKVPVSGTLIKSTMDETVITYKDANYDTEAIIHFPVIGFVVVPDVNA